MQFYGDIFYFIVHNLKEFFYILGVQPHSLIAVWPLFRNCFRYIKIKKSYHIAFCGTLYIGLSWAHFYIEWGLQSYETQNKIIYQFWHILSRI